MVRAVFGRALAGAEAVTAVAGVARGAAWTLLGARDGGALAAGVGVAAGAAGWWGGGGGGGGGVAG